MEELQEVQINELTPESMGGFYDTSQRGTLKLDRAGCGHAILPNNTPRHSNCELCWFIYFQINGSISKLAEEILANHGELGLVQIKGRKFTKQFKRFLTAIEEYKKHANTRNE